MLEIFSHLILYCSIVLAVFLLHGGSKYYYLGVLLVAISLQMFDLPDIQDYKEHYDLSALIGLDVFALYNFELGYVFITLLVSNFVPFEIFYCLIIFLTLLTYSRLFKLCYESDAYLCMLIFLSLCLYFVSFTLRTTLASVFLALSFCQMKDKKNFFAFILILVGTSFHAIVVPFLIMPLINASIEDLSKSLLDRYFPFILGVLIAIALFVSQFPLVDYLAQSNDFIKFKLTSYEESNKGSQAFFYYLWLMILLILNFNYKCLSAFDRLIITTYALILFSMNNLEFFQGRFMWLTSFLFAIFFVKALKVKLILKSKDARIMLILLMPTLTFIRF